MRIFRITNYSNHKHPIKYRIALWFYGWLMLFDALVYICSFTTIDGCLSLSYLLNYVNSLSEKKDEN